MDAIVVHSEHGAGRLRDELKLDPAKVHVIPHGILDNLAAVQPVPLFAKTKPVVLFFGLIRPYKGLDVLLDGLARRRARTPSCGSWACRGWTRRSSTARACARRCGSSRAPSSRARSTPPTSSCCPTARSTSPACCSPRSAFGKPLLLSSVGGFPEIEGAELVPPGDVPALAQALTHAARRPGEARADGGRVTRARRPARYGWDGIAQRTLALYEAVQA